MKTQTGGVHLFFAACLLLCSLTAAAQARQPGQAKAQWIWSAGNEPNTWLVFRREVSLKAKPQRAVVRIAAENKYWLYVNGKLVVRDGGLDVRPGFENTYCDEVNLSPYLQKGENVVAALVWHKGGKDGYTQTMANKGGFFFDAKFEGTPSPVSDKSWKVMPHPAFQKTTQGLQWRVVKWVAWPVAYDARSDLGGWANAGFDDTTWEAATEEGAEGAKPWGRLLPRTIPFWKDFGQKPYLNSPALQGVYNSDTTLTATLGANIQGTPCLRVMAPAGVKVRIWLNEFYWQEYTTRNGLQEFECYAWQNSNNHWVRYAFSNLQGRPVEVRELAFRQTGYNTEMQGSFSSSDTLLNKLWEKSRATSYVCMRDIFFDCPNRERGQWWGDVSEQIMYSFYLYNGQSNLLVKKAYRELFNTQKPDGSLYTTAPGKEFHLPDQNLAAAATLWTYYLYTGDSALLRELYPGLKRFVAYCASTANTDGMLLLQPKAWNWIDWGGNMDVKVGSANTVCNAMYAVFLESMINTANLFRQPADKKYYQGLRAKVKNHFTAYFWNPAAAAYVFHNKEGAQSDTIEDRSNAWAVLAGMADDSIKKAGVLHVLRSRYNAGPYQEMYIELALSLLDGEAALARMRSRYAAMVNSWSSTLWEEFPANNSNNHAWSAGPVYHLAAYTLGVRPLKKGFEEFLFLPQRSGLTEVSAAVPTAKGIIHASFSQRDGGVVQEVEVPRNAVAVVGLIKPAGFLHVITANNRVVWQNGKPGKTLTGLQFIREDAERVYFKTVSGKWKFVLRPVN